MHIYTYSHHNVKFAIIVRARASVLQGQRGLLAPPSLPRAAEAVRGLHDRVKGLLLAALSISAYCLHFSICACQFCVGAMLIFSVSF